MPRVKKYKLSDDDVREIHRRALSGESQISIANHFNISSSCVSRLLSGNRIGKSRFLIKKEGESNERERRRPHSGWQ